MDKLVFIYNANSGKFNLLADIAHKTFSPSTYSCNLCKITYGILKEKNEWKSFIKNLGIKCEFLHKDEFQKLHPNITNDFPALFSVGKNSINLLLNSEIINKCESISDLKSKITNVIE